MRDVLLHDEELPRRDLLMQPRDRQSNHKDKIQVADNACVCSNWSDIQKELCLSALEFQKMV